MAQSSRRQRIFAISGYWRKRTASNATGSRRPSPRRLRGEGPKSQPNDPAGLHQPSPTTRRKSGNGMGFVEEVVINPGPLVDCVGYVSYVLKTTALLNSPPSLRPGKKVRRTSRA